MERINASTKKQIQRAIKANRLEVMKADSLIRQLQEIRKQFRGFRKLESLVTKTLDHESTLNDVQAWVRVSIEKFEGVKTQAEALRQLFAAENIQSYEHLQEGNQKILKEWKHVKDSWRGDKKFLQAVERSREKGFEGQLTFFR